MKNCKKLMLLMTLFLIFIGSIFGCSFKDDDFTTIQIWHYYNGAQKIAFDELINEFNDTQGFEKGIYVEAFNQGDIGNLEKEIKESMEEKVGSRDLPDIVTIYPDMALKMDEKGYLVNYEDHLKDKDIQLYVDSYIEEGYLNKNSGLKLFPIAKATEILMVNKTDWDKFSHATGAKIDDLKSWEGISKLSEDYYNWTETQGMGKSFFGRDAMANYMIIGAKQLGQEIFQVVDGQAKINIDNRAMKKLWDNYYIPYVKGYFVSHGRFSSDDAKVGDIIALVGSTTGAAYFPNKITIDENPPYDIEALILPLPKFEGRKPIAIQQGAGAGIIKSDNNREKASIEFLQWFTQSSRNIEFSSITGYLPVTKEANNLDVYKRQIEEYEEVPPQLKKALVIAMEQMKEYELHISKSFKNSVEARGYLSKSLIDKAKEDRAKVKELIGQGDSAKEAIDKIVKEKDFENWLVELKENLEDIVTK